VSQTAIHSPQGEGRSLWILDQLMTFKVHQESETMWITEFEIPPESGAPPHLHRTQDETHHVLEGHFEYVLADRKVNARAGSVVYVPRTTVHAFTNTGTDMGRILFIEAPAGPALADYKTTPLMTWEEGRSDAGGGGLGLPTAGWLGGR
jgi:mannose-6-phosphate isomerase-like protein (cupin superfamily)